MKQKNHEKSGLIPGAGSLVILNTTGPNDIGVWFSAVMGSLLVYFIKKMRFIAPKETVEFFSQLRQLDI